MNIYKITNRINNKIYIGKDEIGTPHRIKSYMGSGKLIIRAVAKYGVENFKKDIIYESADKLDLRAKEKYYINLFDSTNPSIGYNICLGGEGGQTQSNENLKSAALLRWKNEDYRIKQHSSRKGRSVWNKGISYNADYRKKLSDSKKHRKWVYKIENGAIITKCINNPDEYIQNGWVLGRYSNYKNKFVVA